MNLFDGIEFKNEKDGRHIKRVCKPKEVHTRLDRILGIGKHLETEPERVVARSMTFARPQEDDLERQVSESI